MRRALATILLALMPALSATATETPSGWQLEARASRLNPEWTDHLLWTGAVNETQGFGGVAVRPVLLLQCRQGDMAVVFDFGAFVGGGTVRIEYRIGTGKVLAGDVTVAPDGLRLRVVPPAGDPLIAAFDLSGLEAAVKPLREGCGWE
jgi:hypothetical protein